MEYASAAEYLVDKGDFDIVFLDIEMKAKETDLDGMLLAKNIRGMNGMHQPIIIFVTGFERYVYDAFDVGAFHYLLKPVEESKFAEVFKRAIFLYVERMNVK